MDPSFVYNTIRTSQLVSESVVTAALAVHADADAARASLPPAMLRQRRQRFLFDASQYIEGEWEVDKAGRAFSNVSATTEASLTVKCPIVRKAQDNRVIRFSVELAGLDDNGGPQKGFYGIGVVGHALVRCKEGVTSKQKATLYYSNGWVSSFGATLDKTGNLPNFGDGDVIGIEISFKHNSLRFMINGRYVGPVVQLHSVRTTSNQTARLTLLET